MQGCRNPSRGGDTRLSPPSLRQSRLSLGVLSRLPGEGWGAGGTPWGRRGGGGGSAGAHAHAACDPRPFFINEKNVQGLNDRQEQIYSSSPEIKLK